MDSEQNVGGRNVGVGALFGLVYATSISSIYFALGVVAHHANGLTPEVFIAAGVFFQLAAMTYAEAASLHPERGGSASFARYAFNELVSFIAGWAIVLDYTILVAVAAISAPAYLSVFVPTLGHGVGQFIGAMAVIVLISVDNLIGVSARRLRRRTLITIADLVLQGLVIVLGLVLIFHPGRLTAAVNLGTEPSASDLGFALPVAVVAFAGLESAASLAAEVTATTRELRRLVSLGSLAIVLVYVGIAVVGVGALPVNNGVTQLGQQHLHAPMLGIAEAFKPPGLADVLKYMTGIAGAVGLLAAADAAMLGVSRVGYSLATNRQIPSGVGRLSNRWSTPWVVIFGAAIAAAALAAPTNLTLLVGIYAFGALVSFGIAHLSVIAMRFREPGGRPGYRIPWSVPVRGARVPVPAVLGALLSLAGWIALVVFHTGARYVGVGWLLLGVGLYVGYRKFQDKPVLRRITIPERALRHETAEPEFGSILVPIFGTPLDDDIIQTAGRLAGDTRDELTEEGATIEAIWVFEIPMSLPLDAPLPKSQTDHARAALKRAREIGEDYEGVEVATAMVRARRAGQGIVHEARRRGVEVIVLAAEEPSGIRGGALLGAAPLENFVNEATKYVVSKAPCRVILTAPPANWREQGEASHADGEAGVSEDQGEPGTRGTGGEGGPDDGGSQPDRDGADG